MKFNSVSITKAIQEVEDLLEKESSINPALRAAIKIIIMLVTILANRLNLNSNNSSKPPASDTNRVRGSKKEKSTKKRGGQNGHIGVKLTKVENPDEIEIITIDKRTLPKGQYKDVGYEARQVIDMNISMVVTEYRAQILEDAEGNRHVAPFPSFVKSEVQYGNEVKTHAVYMSQFQLIPYQRIQDHFHDQMGIPLSTGSIFNFNQEAYEQLELFDTIVKQRLADSSLMHADETGINVNGKRLWLHSASNDLWTYFYPHEKRGSEAMDAIGIIPKFKGILCHDHWKPYYQYSCQHALCNAHHIRELTLAEEEDHQQWAVSMKELLLEINQAVDTAGGKLDPFMVEQYRLKYRSILKQGGEKECPPPEKTKEKGRRGRIKKTKSRNLLERLIEFEDDVLRFMENRIVPFTNNQGENDLRMTKVQQKISGCFRSMGGAYAFCRIRSYLSTCRKHGVSATESLRLLFQGKLPDFLSVSKN